MDANALVSDAIRTQFPAFTGEITDDTVAGDVPGWDSAAHLQLMLLIEEMSGKEIDIGTTFEIESVGDLVKFVQNS